MNPEPGKNAADLADRNPASAECRTVRCGCDSYQHRGRDHPAAQRRRRRHL